MKVVGAVGREFISVVAYIVYHATADEGGVNMSSKVFMNHHGAERGGIHFVSGETDGIGGSFIQNLWSVSCALSGINDDEAVLLVDGFGNLFNIEKLATIDVAGTI